MEADAIVDRAEVLAMAGDVDRATAELERAAAIHERKGRDGTARSSPRAARCDMEPAYVECPEARA